MWAEETRPVRTIAPDDGLLCRAVLNNHARWVDAILKYQPCIQVTPGRERFITETALGIAMENGGVFGMGAGFMCGCHRRYRDDDYCEAEDHETWVPRTEWIADRLKKAGAIDYSPFLKACGNGDTEEVDAMLKRGFHPNFLVYGHTTALLEAVASGNEEMCDLLLCYGADPNQVREFETSMTYGGEIHPVAMAMSHPAILKRLLAAGADPYHQRDNDDSSPSLLTVDFSSQEHAEEIFSMVDFASLRGSHGRSALFYLHGDNLLYCRNVIPPECLNVRDDCGVTPLLQAIIAEEPGKAGFLLEIGADPTLEGMLWSSIANASLRVLEKDNLESQWVTPIQAAMILENPDLVEYFLDLGVPPKRHTWRIQVPNQIDPAISKALLAQLDAEIEALKPTSIVKSNGVEYSFGSKIHAIEARLATLLMHDPTAADRHSEWIKSQDLVEWAVEKQLHPALIEPFRSGRKLDHAGWLGIAERALTRVEAEIEVLASAVEEDQRQGTLDADGRDALLALDRAESAWMQARQRITGKPVEPPSLSSEACDRASGEFSGGTARARRSAAATGEVSFDDFIDCLKESTEPGTTMDIGKLVQALRLVTKRLKTRCAKLREKR